MEERKKTQVADMDRGLFHAWYWLVCSYVFPVTWIVVSRFKALKLHSGVFTHKNTPLTEVRGVVC